MRAEEEYVPEREEDEPPARVRLTVTVLDGRRVARLRVTRGPRLDGTVAPGVAGRVTEPSGRPQDGAPTR